MTEPTKAALISIGSSGRARTGLTSAFAMYGSIGIGVVIAALILRRPELVALAVPSLVVVAIGVLGMPSDRFGVSASFDRDRYVEGDIALFDVELQIADGSAHCIVEVDLPPGGSAVDSLRVVASVVAGAPRVVRIPIELTEWGAFSPRRLTVRVVEPMRVLARSYDFTVECTVRVSLHDERLRSPLEPDRHRQVTGGHLSTDRGEGTELADVREYRPGDPMRWINWRISNRRREPWVTVRHPDRSSTLVILVDAFTLSGDKQRAVARAAEALARVHLDLHDRVGLLVLSKSPTWIVPALGKRQLYRIRETLIDMSARTRQQMDVDPAHIIASDAVIVAISTLDDARILGVLARLRTRGRAVSVVEPHFASATLTSSLATEARSVPLARRLYVLEREARRRRLRERGLRVVPWYSEEPIDVPVGQLRRLQQMSGSGPK